MSKENFTPGPWEHDLHVRYIFAKGVMVAELCRCRYLPGNGGHVKELSEDESEKIMGANGALIETAPDMYEFLSALEFNLPPEYSDFSMEIINVLKKARGEK